MPKKPTLLVIFLLAIFLSIFSLSWAQGDTPVKVRDLSGAKYEKAVISLFDHAQESIVISMYYIGSCAGEKNPVRMLLNDLLEARQRGVSVTMYLNTCFALSNEGDGAFIDSPIYKELKAAGCKINLVPSYRRLHDKLIIIDGRYVVVGSANWSISALRRNFESSTLIDSPAHAQEKLKHLEEVASFINSNSQITNTAYYLQELPEQLNIADQLLTNKKYFSCMVTRQDARVLDLYLLLLARSQLNGESEFFINLEDMGLSLGMSAANDYTGLRKQVIKALKRLQSHYHLVTVKFYFGKDAFVKLADIQGDAFSMPSNTIIQSQDKGLTMRLKFLLLIKAFVISKGEDFGSIPKSDLARRFGVNKTTILDAFKDLGT